MRANYYTHTWRCNYATGTERDYVETALENCTVILGRDAHKPEHFAQRQVPEQGMDLIRRYGLTLLETVDFRPIG